MEATLLDGVGSLFGNNKVKMLERENAILHREVIAHEETIEYLQVKIQTMQTDHNRQVLEIQQQHRKEMEWKDSEHKKEVSELKLVMVSLSS